VVIDTPYAGQFKVRNSEESLSVTYTDDPIACLVCGRGKAEFALMHLDGRRVQLPRDYGQELLAIPVGVAGAIWDARDTLQLNLMPEALAGQEIMAGVLIS
jgi:hypothetical protein